jgi:hypothetical protein
MLFLFVKILLNMLVRAFVLLREKGLGWWMIACVWDTAFLIIMAPYKVARAATHAIMDPVDPVADVFDPNKRSDHLQGQLEDQAAQLRELSSALAGYESEVNRMRNNPHLPPKAPPPSPQRDGSEYDHRIHNPLSPFGAVRLSNISPPKYGEETTVVIDSRLP